MRSKVTLTSIAMAFIVIGLLFFKDNQLVRYFFLISGLILSVSVFIVSKWPGKRN